MAVGMRSAGWNWLLAWVALALSKERAADGVTRPTPRREKASTRGGELCH